MSKRNNGITRRSFVATTAAGATALALPGNVLAQAKERFLANFGEITEDTMPGELSNVLAGRVANLFNFRGPNFTTDAACASGLAAMWAAVDGLSEGRYDAVISGGVDRNMSVAAFVKFCKIGALSATGTRPFDAGADGFVMGEGAALFVLQRLEDAEKAGRRIYAVITGLAGSSDGKGKGITAPNPVGQKLAIQRAWAIAHADPDGHTLGLVASSHVTNHALMKKVPYELAAMVPVTITAQVQLGLVVHPSVPASTVRELVAYAKANPGKRAVATSGRGSNPQLWALAFQQATGTQMVDVPYKGSGAAHPDLLSGQT